MISLMGALSLSANDPDDDKLEFLKTNTVVNVKVDFTNADVEHFTSDQFAAYAESHIDTVTTLFLKEMNKKLQGHNISFDSDGQTNYLFLVQVMSVEEDGASRAIVVVVDMNSVSQLTTFKIRAHGGIFGGFDQLFLEGMARLGENLGDYVLEKLF